MWWFLRHGATAENVLHKIQGHLDTPLSEAGRAQAHVLADRFAFDPRPEIIFTSPLKRAKVTAEILAAALNLQVVEVEDLKEWSLGEAEGDTLENYVKKNPGFEIRWDDFEFHYPGGETKRELAERATRFVASLRNENRIPLIVAHQAILHYIINAALGLPPTAAVPFRLGNCGLAAIKPGPVYNRLVLFQGENKMPWDPPK